MSTDYRCPTCSALLGHVVCNHCHTGSPGPVEVETIAGFRIIVVHGLPPNTIAMGPDVLHAARANVELACEFLSDAVKGKR